MNHFLRTVSSQLSRGDVSRRSFSSGGYGLPSEEEKIATLLRQSRQFFACCFGLHLVDKFVCTMMRLDQEEADRAMAMAHELEEK